MKLYIRWFYLVIVLVLIILLFLEYYIMKHNINFHKYWNPNYYDCKTLKIDSNIDKNRIKMGKKIASESRIVICGLARNDSNIVKSTIERLLFIGLEFKDYRIIIFENDSSDNTRKLIYNISKKYNKIILLDCCDMGSCNCKLKRRNGYNIGLSERIKKMGFYRDRYLDYIKKNLYDFDYMLVIDFDLDGNTNIDGLFENLSYKNWAGIFLNGKNPLVFTFGLKTVTYDSLAYTDLEDEYKNFNINSNKFNINYKGLNDLYRMNIRINKNKRNLIGVKSAFNGYGLYKIKDILNCKYSGNLRCEHSNLAKCINENEGKMYINRNWLGYFNGQGPSDIFQYFR